MKNPYSEKSFAIDIVSDAYNITNPVEIARKVFNDLNISVTVSEVINYLGYTEDYQKEKYTISMKDIFLKQGINE